MHFTKWINAFISLYSNVESDLPKFMLGGDEYGTNTIYPATLFEYDSVVNFHQGLIYPLLLIPVIFYLS